MDRTASLGIGGAAFSGMIFVGPLGVPEIADHVMIGGIHKAFMAMPAGVGPLARLKGPKHSLSPQPPTRLRNFQVPATLAKYPAN